MGFKEFLFRLPLGEHKSIGARIILQINLDLWTDGSIILPLTQGSALGAVSAPTERKMIRYLREIGQQLGIDIPKIGSLGTTAEAQFFPGGLPVGDHEFFNLADGPAYSLVTGNSFRLSYNTPMDTYGRLDFDNLETQLRYIFPVVYNVTHTRNLEEKSILPPWTPQRAQFWVSYGWALGRGIVAVYNETTTWYDPIPNSLVVIETLSTNPNRAAVLMTGEDAEFIITGLQQVKIRAYVVDLETGNVIYAPDNGVHSYWTEQDSYLLSHTQGAWIDDIGFFTVFKCSSIALLDIIEPRNLKIPSRSSYLLIKYNEYTPPESFSIESIEGATRQVADSVGIYVTVLNVPSGVPVAILTFSSTSKDYFILLTNSSSEFPEGVGYTLQTGQQIYLSLHDYVRSYYWLNDVRIATLEGTGIQSPHYKDHSDTYTLLNLAYEARSRVHEMQQYLLEAWANEKEVYYEIRLLAENVVYTVPFYSFLLILFVFILERLIFPQKGMWRIAFLVIVYVAFVALFSQLHPGFALSGDVPMMILAIVILVTVVPIPWIAWSSFMEVLSIISTKLLGSHTINVSRVTASLFVSLLSLSIKKLKRRIFRTSLMMITIALATSAMVLFTSLSPIQVIFTMRSGMEPLYTGIYIEGSLNVPAIGIGKELESYLRSNFEEQAIIAPKVFVYPRTSSPYSSEYVITHGTNSDRAVAMFGLTPHELEIHNEISAALIPFKGQSSRWFIETDVWTAIISDSMAKKLGLMAIPSQIKVNGVNFTVVGVINARVFDGIQDLSGWFIGPFKVVDNERVPISSDDLILVPYHTGLMLGGTTYSISLRFDDEGSTLEAAERITRFKNLVVTVGMEGDTFLFSQRTTLTIFGWQTQLVPLALVCLVLLNMMLGSMYERTKEIWVYSTLGLAPLHISLMFLAEAIIFAIVGDVSGFIVAMGGLEVNEPPSVQSPELELQFYMGFGGCRMGHDCHCRIFNLPYV